MGPLGYAFRSPWGAGPSPRHASALDERGVAVENEEAVVQDRRIHVQQNGGEEIKAPRDSVDIPRDDEVRQRGISRRSADKEEPVHAGVYAKGADVELVDTPAVKSTHDVGRPERTGHVDGAIGIDQNIGVAIVRQIEGVRTGPARNRIAATAGIDRINARTGINVVVTG